MTLLIALLLIPLPVFAFWSWRYGSKRNLIPFGFAVRVLIVVTLGSWAVIAGGGGHGAGFAVVPSLLCGLGEFDRSSVKCTPPFWVTPVISGALFVGLAVAASAKRRTGGLHPNGLDAKLCCFATLLCLWPLAALIAWLI